MKNQSKTIVTAALLATHLSALDVEVAVEPCENVALLSGDQFPGKLFGISVGVSSELLVVGNPDDNNGATTTGAGAVYVFERDSVGTPEPDDDTWAFVEKVAPAAASTDNFFGSALAVDGANMLIGAPGHDGDIGTVYLYDPTDFVDAFPVTEEGNLIPSDGGVPGEAKCFGCAVDLDGPVAIIGADEDSGGFGSAYVFVDGGPGFGETQKLVPTDFPNSPAERMYFGASVAVSGAWAVIGAPGFARGQGSVALYRFDGATWLPMTVLLPDEGRRENLSFGTSVAIDGNTLMVGAPGYGAYQRAPTGAVYVFQRTGPETWTPIDILAPIGPLSPVRRDILGSSIAMVGDQALFGAPGIVGAVGSVFAYERTGGFPNPWVPSGHLVPPGAQPGERFGYAVALSGDAIAIGAPFKGANEGMVYTYSYSCGTVITGGARSADESKARQSRGQ